MAENQITQAVKIWLHCINTKEGTNKMSKEQKEQKTLAETLIHNYLKSSPRPYVPLEDGTFIILKESLKQHPVNEDFIRRVYYSWATVQLPRLQQQHNCSKEQEAQIFLEFFQKMKKGLGSKSTKITISKTKPTVALIEELPQMALNMTGNV